MFLSRPLVDYQAQQAWAARERRRLALGLRINAVRVAGVHVDAQPSVYFRQEDIVRVRNCLESSTLTEQNRYIVRSYLPDNRHVRSTGMVTFRFQEVGMLNRFFAGQIYAQLLASPTPGDQALITSFNDLVGHRIQGPVAAANRDAPPGGPAAVDTFDPDMFDHPRGLYRDDVDSVSYPDTFDPPRGLARYDVDSESYPTLEPVRYEGEPVSYPPREVPTRRVQSSEPVPSNPPPVIRQDIVANAPPRAPAPRASRGFWGSCAVM